MNAVEYAFAGRDDLPAILELLTESELPLDDMESALRHCIVAKCDSRLVGTVALEVLGPFALLRSLAVVPAFRGRSVARTLVSRITRHAQEQHVGRLFLLTMDADAFFMKLGFVRIDRDEAPAEIKGTSQFRSVCPGTAICLTRPLPEAHGQQ